MNSGLLHPEYANGKWNEFTLQEQLANVGSDVIRCIKWLPKNREVALRAANRALELLYFTKADPKNKSRLRELCILYEVLVNDLYGFDDYEADLPALERYFLAYTHWAALTRAARGS